MLVRLREQSSPMAGVWRRIRGMGKDRSTGGIQVVV